MAAQVRLNFPATVRIYTNNMKYPYAGCVKRTVYAHSPSWRVNRSVAGLGGDFQAVISESRPEVLPLTTTASDQQHDCMSEDCDRASEKMKMRSC